MTVRKFVQNGQGYGSSAVEIRAKIDGVTVFEGAVPTVDQTLPNNLVGAIDTTSKIFEWQSTVEFSGTFALEIEVLSGGALLIASTLADHTNPLSLESLGTFYTDENGIRDPLSAVAINGVPDTVPVRNLDPENILDGQWWYSFSTGDVLTAQITVQPGRVPTPVADPVAPT